MQGFNIRKASQVAAFFAIAEGGRVNVLKLVKLIYLADREFMQRYDSTILRDKLVSMNHGPVNSVTLDLINGLADDSKNEWNEFITDRDGHFVGLARRDIDISNLDELSEAELEILEEIAERFRGWTQYQVRDYTHKNCPEWEDPDGSSIPISYQRIFTELGKSEPQALAEAIEEERHISGLLAAE